MEPKLSEPEFADFEIDRSRIISFLYGCGSNNDVWPKDEEEFLEVAFNEAKKLSIDPAYVFSNTTNYQEK